MWKSLKLFVIFVITVLLLIWIVNYIGTKGFLFAWILNFILMTCVFMFTETLKSQFESDYYKEQNWEKSGKIYRSLGINLYRKLLVLVGWEKLNKKANPVNKNVDALLHLLYRTKQSEFGHLIIMFIVTGFNIYAAMKYGILESIWIFTLNILLNFYPIILQRYNRPRLQRALGLYKEREGRSHNST